MIQLTRQGGVVFDEHRVATLRREYRARHCVVMTQFFSAGVLEFVMRRLEEAPFRVRTHHDRAGKEFARELCLAKKHPAQRYLSLLVNNDKLFRWVQAITGCRKIGWFEGRVYQLEAGTGAFDSWHDDVGAYRVAALVVSLNCRSFRGGAFRIRKDASGRVMRKVGDTGLGGAHLFRIRPDLSHMVAELKRGTARTCWAGWFCTRPNYRKVFQKDLDAFRNKAVFLSSDDRGNVSKN